MFTLLLVSSLVYAQDAKLNKADEKFKNLEFAEALDLYKQVVEDNGSNYAMLRMANCYRLVNNPEKAAFWYAKSINAAEGEPINKLFYAQSLLQLGNYDAAKLYFKDYQSWYPDDKRAIAGIESCEKAELWKKRPSLFEVAPFTAVNSTYNDFSPSIIGNDLSFSSDRKSTNKRNDTYGWFNNPFMDNYVSAKQKDGTYGNPQISAKDQNTVYNDGNAVVSPNGKLMAFTRNQYEPWIIAGKTTRSSSDDVVKLKIMLAEYDAENEEWGEPFEASFNNPEFSFTHPAFSADGRWLFFVSDAPGGYGGTDIWKAKLTNDLVFEQAVNLGANVNTSGQDMFPFVNGENQLFFASTGHPGLGGLDIYRSNPDANGLYGSPLNLGLPLNSTRDDFGLVLEKGTNKGFFSSNRQGGLGGDDIYAASLEGNMLILKVTNEKTGQPMEDCELTVYENKEVIDVVKVENGLVVYPLSHGDFYTFSSSCDGFESTDKAISTADYAKGADINEEMFISPEYGSKIEGIVIEENSQLPLDQSRVVLFNKTTGEEEEFTTDNTGLFEYPIEAENEYELVAYKDGYQDAIYKFNTLGMTEKEVRKTKLVMCGGATVCGVAFKHVYFDLDKAIVREDASTDLERMIEILNRSDEAKVEISAHTDSRGSQAYNLNLSEKRAKAVLTYIVDRGIDIKRLTFKGYGESELTNECGDNVECSDEKHQMNRRVEFRVLGKDGQVLCASKSL